MKWKWITAKCVVRFVEMGSLASAAVVARFAVSEFVCAALLCTCSFGYSVFAECELQQNSLRFFFFFFFLLAIAFFLFLFDSLKAPSECIGGMVMCAHLRVASRRARARECDCLCSLVNCRNKISRAEDGYDARMWNECMPSQEKWTRCGSQSVKMRKTYCVHTYFSVALHRNEPFQFAIAKRDVCVCASPARKIMLRFCSVWCDVCLCAAHCALLY